MELLFCWGLRLLGPLPPALHQPPKLLSQASAADEAGCRLLTPVLPRPPFQTFSPNPTGNNPPHDLTWELPRRAFLSGLSPNSKST